MTARPTTDRRSILKGSGTALLAGAHGSLVAGAQAQTPAPGPARPAASGAAPPASAAAAARAVAAEEAAILRISREVWEAAELSLWEERSAGIHLRELEAAGFRTVSRGTAGVPTAFASEWKQGSGGPLIGFLSEYDALPALGNAAEPRQAPAPSGIASGHGCGHNLLGAGCTGAAIALKRMMTEAGIPGTLRVYGCAAEETEGAKVYMARAGLFDDLDAALAWHPAPFAAAGIISVTAQNKAKVTFRGRSAHAGQSPWEGRSALKGAELFGAGVQYMREHLLPTARIHYVYERAGEAPNVVPDHAQLWITIRDADRQKVEASTAWIRDIARGAALMTQTEAEVDQFFGVHELLPNEPLARLLYRHLGAVPIEWTAEEQAFARACQREMRLPEHGLAMAPLPFIENVFAGGSTDVGDVSFLAPVGVFAWPTMPLGVGLHTWAVTACAGMSIGEKASLASARIMAAAGFDLMTDRALREAVKADFRRRRGDRPYVSPIPASRTQPLRVPPHLVRSGEDDYVSALRPAN